jgi:hypothetical protein
MNAFSRFFARCRVALIRVRDVIAITITFFRDLSFFDIEHANDCAHTMIATQRDARNAIIRSRIVL